MTLTKSFLCLFHKHSWSELLDKDELVGVGVEDDHCHAAVTLHQVPDLLLPILTILHPHWSQILGFIQWNKTDIADVLHTPDVLILILILTTQSNVVTCSSAAIAYFLQ